MTNSLSPNKLGLVLGGFLALWHVIWQLLVLLGIAQPFIDWIFELHAIIPPYTIMPFEWVRAITLIVVTFVLGYLMGLVVASLWNMVTKK